MNHFLVVEGFGRDRVYLNDPASGRRTVSLEEFNGVVRGDRLSVRAGAGVPQGRAKAEHLAFGRPAHGGAYTAVAFAVMAGMALMAAELVTATFNPLFVDQILVAERRHWIRPLLAGHGDHPFLPALDRVSSSLPACGV